jgi:adenosylcobinamide-phosphate synthase
MINPLLLAFLTLPGGFLLDAITGDPPWFPHPVRGMGFLVNKGETLFRRIIPKREFLGGTLLVVFMVLVSWVIPFGALYLAGRISRWAAFSLALILTDCCLAARELAIEAMRVYKKTKAGDLEGGRHAVSMIVGRDTERLSSIEEVNKAAVETVAENLSDAVIAPMFYLALGGIPLGFIYKAVNTMDSMIGYKNSRYLSFGRAAAKLDDALNFLPARISGLLIIAASAILKYNPENAFRIFRRDRFNHASPNAGHPEAACAGALGIALGGNAWYEGRLEEKPLIGDKLRSIECEDIKRSIALMYTSSLLFLPIVCALSGGIRYGISKLFPLF